MGKIGLIIGESADLPEEVVKKYQMIVVPYIIDWPEGEKIPGDNIN